MTDEELGSRFLEGDDIAFREIFARHNGRLLAYCIKFVKDRSVAEDLTQETWVKVIGLRASDRKDEIQNLFGMIYRIARNLCLDHLKAPRNANRTSLDTLHDGAHPVESIRELSSEEEIVMRALDRLPIDYRETLVLNLYCGYSYEEIARMQEKSPDAIWARASRGRKKLREMVSEEIRREEEALRVISHNRSLGNGHQRSAG